MRFIKFFLTLIVLVAICIVIARQIWPLPDISDRETETALSVDSSTSLGSFTELAAQHPSQSGVIALPNGADALGSRLALIEKAERSVDAQYYIWHDDASGMLLLDALQKAAARGVRVRLLMDDNGIPGLDQLMATMNAQPNFNIRLFNPSTIRQPKLLGYAIDFFRMNRRMHNKSMIVDGSAAIIGGRNIGDEYFQIGEQFYVDLDALAIGDIVPKTETIFDQYWNSASTFAFERIVDLPADMPAFESRLTEVTTGNQAVAELADTRVSTDRFLSGEIQPEWTTIQVVADDPIKGTGQAREDQLMIARLAEILGKVENRLDLVSAYFVPGEKGTEYFSGLAESGKQVNILTNALDTTDVLMVHAGYTKYRRELLEAGANLFELKLRGEEAVSDKQIKPFGLSGASLHAKTFAVDENRIFIGSFNFDPRSALLNCEMGFLIASPSMAKRVSGAFDDRLAEVSYQPELTPEGQMVWKGIADGKDEIYQQEPGANWFQQVMLTVIGVLPVEWLL